MMRVTFNFIHRRFVVSGWCIHQDQIRLWLHWQDGIESQRVWPIHWKPIKSLWFRMYLITLYPRTQAIPGSDLVLIQLIWRALYDKFAGGGCIQVVGSPSCIFHVIVPDEIGNNPLEYKGVQILDSLSARMRQQPENVDHLRCSPAKTSRYVAI